MAAFLVLTPALAMALATSSSSSTMLVRVSFMAGPYTLNVYDQMLALAGLRSARHLRQLALGVARRDHRQRLGLDLRGLAFAAELQVALLADRLGGFACRLQVVARVELLRVQREELADRAGHREADVGVDV